MARFGLFISSVEWFPQVLCKVLIKAPEGESQPSTEVDLFISTEKIMVLNTDLKVIKFLFWKQKNYKIVFLGNNDGPWAEDYLVYC